MLLNMDAITPRVTLSKSHAMARNALLTPRQGGFARLASRVPMT
jgi:hypothetical protein